MIPVKQDILANDPQGRVGNCLQACIASLCEKELKDVPHFGALHDDIWLQAMADWLYERGCQLRNIETVHDEPNYLLVFGKSKRETYHAVIYKDGKLLHDPHPSNEGLLTVDWIACFEGKTGTLKDWQKAGITA